jgi:hypothetical protein
VPYSGLEKSIYGHYALFYILPAQILHMFGIRYNIAIASLVAVISFITVFSTLYVINEITRQDILYYMLMLSLGEVVLQENTLTYWQMFPHRMVFPAVIAAVCASFCNQKKCVSSMKQNITFWILGLSAILWNTETGIICSIVIILYIVIRDYDFSKGIIVSKSLIKGVKACFWLISEFVAAYLIVQIYNILCNGSIIGIRTFIYPVLSTSYRIENLQISLPNWTGSWFGVLSLFLLYIIFCLTTIIKGQEREGEQLYLVVAVTGLGLLTYYMNRAVQGNLMICYFSVIILFAGLLNKTIDENAKIVNVRNDHKTININLSVGIKYEILFIISALALGNVGLDNVLANREAGAWNTEKLYLTVDMINEDLPENTIGIGIDVPELYAMMDRNTIIHTLDWADIMSDPNPYFPYISKYMDDVEVFFANEDVVNEKVSNAILNKKYNLVKEYDKNGMRFGIYARSDVYCQYYDRIVEAKSNS